MAAGDEMWGWVPPEAPEATLGCLGEPGSLTERLIGSGKDFAVELLFLGDGAAHPDEAAPVGALPGDSLTVRHVALTLDGATVVVARSYCRPGCPVWVPILDRGGRSLGFTLFSGEVALARGALEFTVVAAGHPLYELARMRAPGVARLAARRCRFELDGAPLVVCEVFLPELERQLGGIPQRAGLEPVPETRVSSAASRRGG
ncbi:MAG: chorismate lyase [Alphaproteobacteria bacterium]|nr:chorismate lyase [Alphaproteobacteria bacterium]